MTQRDYRIPNDWADDSDEFEEDLVDSTIHLRPRNTRRDARNRPSTSRRYAGRNTRSEAIATLPAPPTAAQTLSSKAFQAILTAAGQDRDDFLEVSLDDCLDDDAFDSLDADYAAELALDLEDAQSAITDSVTQEAMLLASARSA